MSGLFLLKPQGWSMAASDGQVVHAWQQVFAKRALNRLSFSWLQVKPVPSDRYLDLGVGAINYAELLSRVRSGTARVGHVGKDFEHEDFSPRGAANPGGRPVGRRRRQYIIRLGIHGRHRRREGFDLWRISSRSFHADRQQKKNHSRHDNGYTDHKYNQGGDQKQNDLPC
jgi:hypothetical protein